ncbi:MAG: hypothetical protein COW03_10275 [Cytophagales bacterium CG12_big_fil_rev_8_21_14_0_65_40_12]|nr:MAG: hypothetical protein COW03_10275 [Cytophagales bacterium CG12_big_fil_rev_8_21_14_0_65_40_12]PIW03871.1 MAG: hypothetical protein COW40_12755 [Cytophagales bacterium CG17_big_fil_post_rev_8_21_14_2_50_40_13]
MVSQEFSFGDQDLWEVNGTSHVFERFEGKESLSPFQSQVRLKNFEFFTGILEYDIYITPDRGFPGINFRIQGDGNYEEFYVRPHQSGNPDANQYTPVFNGLASWQLYYGEGFAQAVKYQMNSWNHIKLVVAESTAEVYVNDMNTPLYYIPELKRVPKAGSLGFNGGGPAAFRIADLKVTKQSNPELKSQPYTVKPLEKEVIPFWLVSSLFSEITLQKPVDLSSDMKKGLEWKKVNSENIGYVNLARVAIGNGQNNTVFAKVTIVSDKDQIKKLSYGFSDRVKVYLNDQLLVGGHDEFTSRDYRFLGTMGYFDDVYLRLKKGDNELWMAVSENFGGWGVMGKFDNLDGIRIK